jgi:hypothetical protein
MAGASSAQAAKSIGGFVGGAAGGGDAGPIGGFFTQPNDVAHWRGADAVDPADDKVFVVERGAFAANGKRVQRFDADGNFELAWGWDVIVTGGLGDVGAAFEVCTLAADCKFPGVVGPAGGQLDDPTGIAVDQVDGSVYVYDRDNKRIQVFDGSTGEFERMFGDGVNQTSGGDLCPRVGFPADVCGIGAGGPAAGQIGPAGSTTLQPRLDVAPGTRDVFVADPSNRRVQRFDPQAPGFDGSPLETFGGAGTTNPGEFNTNQPLHVAVDSAGIVYASDSNNDRRIQRYDSAGGTWLAPIVTTASGGPLLPASDTDGLKVDPDSDGGGVDVDRLYILRDPPSGSADTIVQQVDSPGTVVPPVNPPTATHVLGNAAPSGLGVNESTADLYVVGVLPAGHGFYVLIENGGVPPVASLSPPPAAGAHTATLEGTVDPNGSTRYRFEISKDGVIWTPAGAEIFINGSDQVTVTQQVAGLEANTLYRVRLVASKYTGLTTVASDTSAELIFATDALSPDAATLPATSRRATSASLQGRINPNGSLTTYHFEYGPTPTYGQQVPVPAATAGGGGVEKLVVQQLSGLSPGTDYHYRLVAENPIGTTVGADATFKTRSSVEAPPGRGYELVSQPDKATGPGLGSHGNNSELGGELGLVVGTPSVDGDRFVSRTEAGPVLTGGASVYVSNTDLSERTADGWRVRSAWNRPNYGSSLAPFLEPRNASDDLSLMLFGNRGGATQLFPEQADWPTNVPYYLRGWDDRWRLIAPTTDTVAGAWIETGASIADDGSRMTFASVARGLLGPGDPTSDLAVGARAAYVVDVTGPLSDTFGDPDALADPNRGPTALLAACTGSGASRTLLPEVVGGKLMASPCSQTPAVGRDAVLTSPLRGAGVVAAPPGAPVGASTENAVSSDGARAFFMSPDPILGGTTTACSGPGFDTCPPQIYVRQVDGDGNATVRWLSRSAVANQDASLSGVPGQEGNGSYYEGASRDGDKVFFRTNAPLTADDPNANPLTPVDPRPVTTGSASNSSWDLYVYDLPDGPGSDPADGALTRVSAGPLGTGDCNVSAQSGSDALRFLSDDGSRAYFTCAQPLPGVPAPSDGTVTAPGGTPAATDSVNLYLYDASKPLAQRWRFVARLPRGIAGVDPIAACATTAAGSQAGLRGASTIGEGLVVDGGRTCVRGNGEGTLITFWTKGRLVATDPDASVADMYGYDADADELVRLSAPQGGAGGTYTCITQGNVQCHGDPGFTGAVQDRMNLTVATDPVVGEKAAYFESRSRLVAADTDDEMDVYEWRDGDLSLMSTGIEGTGAYSSGISRDGRNVFIVTDAALTWQDIDAVRDAYTVRIGGGFPEPIPPTPCLVLAGQCQGPGTGVSTPVQPKTSSLAGDGNVVSGSRPVVSLRKLPLSQRRKAARTGILPIRVRTSAAGKLSLSARAKLGKRTSRVGRKTVRIRKAGVTRVNLRLNSRARAALKRGRTLNLSVQVRQSGARTRTLTVTLKRSK